MGISGAHQRQLLFYYLCHAPFYGNDKNTHSLFVHLTVSELFSPMSAVGTNSFRGGEVWLKRIKS